MKSKVTRFITILGKYIFVSGKYGNYYEKSPVRFITICRLCNPHDPRAIGITIGMFLRILYDYGLQIICDIYMYKNGHLLGGEVTAHPHALSALNQMLSASLSSSSRRSVCISVRLSFAFNFWLRHDPLYTFVQFF